jgi:hypothetical protein
MSAWQGTKIFNFVNAYGCSIDDNSKIGALEIQKGAFIGRIVKFPATFYL